ncbi:MAG: TIGR02266 family protein [Myxococcota bacterium]
MSESEPRTPRVPLRVKVDYDLLDDFLDDYTANISMGGMFVRSETPMDVDTTFRIRFSLPGRATPIEATATVRWVVLPNDPAGLVPGMGIQFDGLSDGDHRAIERWMRRYEAALDAANDQVSDTRAA